jgi:hypothetical protein
MSSTTTDRESTIYPVAIIMDVDLVQVDQRLLSPETLLESAQLCDATLASRGLPVPPENHIRTPIRQGILS